MNDVSAKRLEILLHPVNFFGMLVTIATLGIVGNFLIVKPIQHMIATTASNHEQAQRLRGLDQLATNAGKVTTVTAGMRTVVGSAGWKLPSASSKTCAWQVGAVIRAVSVGPRDVLVEYKNTAYMGTGTGCWNTTFTISQAEFLNHASLFIAARKACPEKIVDLSHGRCRSR
jgi:hypothetical protein